MVTLRTPDGLNGFHVAAYRKDPQLIALLAQNGGNVNDASNLGWTPLHEAIRRGDQKCAEELIKYGADVNCIDRFHITPLKVTLGITREDSRYSFFSFFSCIMLTHCALITPSR
jgi:hypothetical protein